MPTTQKRTQPKVIKREFVEDVEIKPEKRSTATKDVPVSTIITQTLADRMSYSAAHAISTGMLETVGKEYAITPTEAYSLTYPTIKIIAHYLPGTVIKIGLPGDVADNLEKIIVTSLEYLTRISARWFKIRFDRAFSKAGIERPTNNEQKPNNSANLDTLPNKNGHIASEPRIETNAEEDGTIPISSGPIDFEILKADDMIPSDTGQNM